MARILCGVQGDAMGHVSDALALAQALPKHQFYFLGGGKARLLGQAGYPLEPLPVLGTAYRDNRVDVVATMGKGARALAAMPTALARAERAMRHFRPQLVLSFYEAFTQLAAKRLGLTCLSLDHQHFLSQCHALPMAKQEAGRLLFRLAMSGLATWADRYLVHSFFPLTPGDPFRTEVFPPLLWPGLVHLRTDEGNHVVAYQTSATFHRLLPALLRWGRPCLVYGLGARPSQGNLIFRAQDRGLFLKDLASCRFLVANGGHTAISEALFLGKPVLSLPIALAYEQYANAYMLRHLGYGDFSLSRQPRADLFQSFEDRLGQFRAAIAGGDFHGTARLARRVEQLLEGG